MPYFIDHHPPLTVYKTRALFDRREVNMNWLAGTVLTGIVGFVLMGGAFFSATGGVTRFAINPEIAKYALQIPQKAKSEKKGNKLNPLSYSPVTRQSILVQTRAQLNDREIIKSKNYIRLSAPLLRARSHLTAKLPSFSQIQYLNISKSGPEKMPLRKNTNDAIEGEVSLISKDLIKAIQSATAPVMLDPPLMLSEIISSQAFAPNTQSSKTATVIDNKINPEAPTDLFIANSVSNQEGTKVADIKITTANMSAISKDSSDPLRNSLGEDENVIVRAGTSLLDIILSQGVAGKEAQILSQLLMGHLPLGAWKEGLKVQFSFEPIYASGENRIPERVRILADKTTLAVAVQSDLGQFVIIDENDDDREQVLEGNIANDSETDDQDTRISLYHSLFETGLSNGVPQNVLNEFIRIASFDLDFERKIKQGDSIEFFYADDEGAAQQSNDAHEILYAAISLNGNTRKFYRFQTSDDDLVDYYDENGRSAKKFLLRKPMNGGTFRSPFGSRRHPILGYTRMHTGVDWSAPRGTPILAAGHGVVDMAGWKSGYGQYVLIKHSNGYESGYAHMSAIAPNIKDGSKVSQGQVIGYVGSTGLSTGNHLHYEVSVNGRFVDPLRIKIPQGRALTGEFNAQFERERDRIDGLINRAPASTKSANL